MNNGNVLLILVDQVITDSLSAYGGICKTPALERLSSRGVTFRNAYTPLAVCSPARASIFTGMLPHNHGILYNTTGCSYGRSDIEDDELMITNHLKGSGYRTGYIGKWHIGQKKGPREYGFEGTKFPGYGIPSDFVSDYDDFLKENGHPGMRGIKIKNLVCGEGMETELTMPTQESIKDKRDGAKVYCGVVDLPTELTPAGFVAGRTIEYLREHKDEKFFLTTSFWGPHHPALPSPEFAGLHDPDSIPEWANFRDELKNKPLIQKRYAERLHRKFTGAGWDTWKGVVASHFDHMAMIDAQIGRILDELESLGLDKNTTIMFTADHGDTLGCHGGQWDKGPYMFEETHRVPLIISKPDMANAGGNTDAFATNMDMFPTVLGLCGADIPENIDSKNLTPILAGEAQSVRDCVTAEFYGFDIRGTYFQRMIRMDKFKYTYAPSDIDEFYDLEKDPAELDNLIDSDEYADDIKRLKLKLYEEMKTSADPFAEPAYELMGL